MGLTPLYLWLDCLLIVRNQRILVAYDARQACNDQRAAAGFAGKGTTIVFVSFRRASAIVSTFSACTWKSS